MLNLTAVDWLIMLLYFVFVLGIDFALRRHMKTSKDFFQAGILGLGLTALLASFMSGMAGNVTAFSAVFTYDLYQSYIHKNASDRHYLAVGRWATVGGILLRLRPWLVARA